MRDNLRRPVDDEREVDAQAVRAAVWVIGGVGVLLLGLWIWWTR